MPPLPIGIGEWNNVANSPTCIPLADWNGYTDYLISFLKPLGQAGRMGDVMIWMGNNPRVQTQPDDLLQLGGNCNQANPPYDPIVNMRKVYDALSAY